MKRFDYADAFSRNIGWITPAEQGILRGKRVAIAGLGGVGGAHLLTLTRLGIGHFHISDLDRFEVANFNRQAGASLATVGRPKVDVLAEMARDIDPELDLRLFPQGVGPENLDAFLDGVDCYLDGLDYFAIAARRAVFAACAAKGIPAITAAPLGMGAAVLNFLPGGMTFEDYFRLEGQPELEQLIRFLLGLSPAMLQRGYLVHPQAVDLAAHRGPSTPMACDLCAGMAATQALKILLGRGPVRAAPWGQQFDAYRDRYVHTWRPGGNAHPLQRLGLAIARRQLAAAAPPVAPGPPPATPLERILDQARWAPSGDNTQPWHFRVRDPDHFEIHGRDTRDWCVYDLEGHASWIALGALLETIALAATREGLEATFQRRPEAPETAPVVEVALRPLPAGREPDPLAPWIPERRVQRRPLSTRPLTPAHKQALEAAVGPGYRVTWVEGWGGRWRMARLLFRNAHIRLTIPEAYRVHRRIIEWDARYSLDRIPDQALGADPLTLKLMRWAMTSWERVRLLNRWFAGTWMPRLQLDLLPALGCGAHFLISAGHELQGIDDYLAGGRALQRLWLTATSLGLQIQPEMTPLIFSEYVRRGVRFSGEAPARHEAASLAADLDRLLGDDGARRVFLGRIGRGPAAVARSLRLPRERLLQPD